MKLSDWKRACGLAADSWTHEREVEGLLQAYWPGDVNGRSGWWWCIADPVTRMFLAGGWSAGSVRDRNTDIARGMVRHSPRIAS